MGGLLIGICLALSTDGILQGNWRLLLVTGFLGGFTTFSTFSVDLLQYLRDGAFKSFFLLACVSNGGGLLAAAVGFFGFRAIFR
jgi:CrcB protein